MQRCEGGTTASSYRRKGDASGSNTADGAILYVSTFSFCSTICQKFRRCMNREYSPRIHKIDQGTFTPIVFSCIGGNGPEATTPLMILALELSNKSLEP